MINLFQLNFITNIITNLLLLGTIIYLIIKNNNNNNNISFKSGLFKNNENNENNKLIKTYDHKKCMKCIQKNDEDNVIRDCLHCGSENYDTGCIPAIIQEGKPNNCVPKELSPEEAYWACKSVSSGNNYCSLITNEKLKRPYMKKECGDDYYCGYDESDSCSYGQCYLGKYYNPNSKCKCEKVPHEKLDDGIGRVCFKKNCEDYHPIRKPTELLHDYGLSRFFSGYASYMDVPNIVTKEGELLVNQIVA